MGRSEVVAGAFALAGMVIAVAAAAQEVIELPAEDRPLEADFEEVYRAGSLAGEDWEQFGRIASLAFDGAGNLYVLDRQAARVVVVSPDASHLRSFGRAGDGPGEEAADRGELRTRARDKRPAPTGATHRDGCPGGSDGGGEAGGAVDCEDRWPGAGALPCRSPAPFHPSRVMEVA